MPSSFANGSRKSAHTESRLAFPTWIFASSHIISPAGAATAAARRSTKSVLSNIERTIILPICGRRYGGSSKLNEDGMPFSRVFERMREMNSVIATPNTITPVSISVETIDLAGPSAAPAKNIVIIAMSVGNAPPYVRQFSSGDE